MKKLSIILLCLALAFGALFLSSCSDTGSSSGNGGSGGSSSADGSVTVTTEAYFSKTIGGVQNASDKTYCSEDVYLYVKVQEVKNTSYLPQAISMVITIDNAKYMSIENESSENADPQINEIQGIDGEMVTTISNISFTVNANSTKKPTTYVFKVRPINACAGKIKISYSNEKISDGSLYTKAYTFYERENLDKIDAPVISTNKDRFFWTESPIPDTDKKLYLVQILDKSGNECYNEKLTKNELLLSEISQKISTGDYELIVSTLGDKTYGTKDSDAQKFEFAFVAPVSAQIDEKGVVSWEAQDGASGYDVIVGDTYSVFTENTSFNIPFEYDGGEKKLEISVLPIYNDESIVCVQSNVVSATILDSPIVAVSGSKASWTAIEGAVQYDIYINGEFIETITKTEFRKRIGENLMLTVVARGGNCSVSKPSQEVDISTD